MSKGGDFEIKVWVGGHPIWCELHYKGQPLTQINSLELRDLEYAVKQARREARKVARDGMDVNRVEDY